MSQIRLRLLPYIADYWLYRVTRPGKFLVVGTTVAAFLGAASLSIPIYHLFCALFALVAVAVAASFVFRPTMRIRGQFPESAAAGQPFQAEFLVDNLRRVPAYDLELCFLRRTPRLEREGQGVVIRKLAAGAMAHVTLTYRPLRRGLVALPPLRAVTSFPFHVHRQGGTKKPLGNLLILPSFHRLNEVEVPMSRRYQPGGVALTSNVGESPEYIGNRYYQPGDSIRRLDYRSWGRLGVPVVREFQEEYYCRIALVLDTYVPGRALPPRGGFAQLEAAVSLAAAVADALARGEHLIDVFAAGPDLYVFHAGRHIAHLENILEILALVEACRTHPFEEIGPALAEELRNITTVVYVLLDWDETREGFVRAAVEAGCAVRVLLVRDDEPTRDPGPAEDWLGPVQVLSPQAIRGGEVDHL